MVRFVVGIFRSHPSSTCFVDSIRSAPYQRAAVLMISLACPALTSTQRSA
jgi:hypothetical protein